MRYFVIFAAIIGLSLPALAEFAISVSPPRFEIKTKPGARVMEIVRVFNEAEDGMFSVKTNDWTFSNDANVVFHDKLLSDSCREWVSIEKKNLFIKSKRQAGYRVQIDVPADAKPQECRFALMIEGGGQKVSAGKGVELPVSGRVAIIFYVAVGPVSPDLSIVNASTRVVNGNKVPSLEIRNSGSAHGRLSGFLSGTDAAGTKFSFEPSTFPVLPGETRQIDLTPVTGRKEVGVVKYPVTVSGDLEWGDQKTSFENKFD